MARPKKQLTDAEAAKMRDVEAYTHAVSYTPLTLPTILRV